MNKLKTFFVIETLPLLSLLFSFIFASKNQNSFFSSRAPKIKTSINHFSSTSENSIFTDRLFHLSSLFLVIFFFNSLVILFFVSHSIFSSSFSIVSPSIKVYEWKLTRSSIKHGKAHLIFFLPYTPKIFHILGKVLEVTDSSIRSIIQLREKFQH